jgi:transposase
MGNRFVPTSYIAAKNKKNMLQQNVHQKEIGIKPCNHRQLAKAYGISYKVLKTWLKPWLHELGKRKGYKYSLEQLLIIIEKLGLPMYSIE